MKPGSGQPAKPGATVDILVNCPLWRSERGIRTMLRHAIAEAGLATANGGELAIVLSNDAAVRALNRDWRRKDQPTNVLSFPAARRFRRPSPWPVPRGRRGPAASARPPPRRAPAPRRRCPPAGSGAPRAVGETRRPRRPPQSPSQCRHPRPRNSGHPAIARRHRSDVRFVCVHTRRAT